MARKRLFFDIETSFNLCGVFSIGQKISLGYESILQERAIICICYKWEGESKVHELHWDKNKCDKKLLIDFLKVANTAHEIVGHNSDNFDTKWVRTRCFFHRIPMFPKYTSIDTLKEARRFFRYNSNRLDYISKFSGSKGKAKSCWSMWVNITMHNDQKDLKKMIRYCKRDVTELQKVFTAMKPYIGHKTHYGVISGGDKRTCPEGCSSTVRKVRKTMSAAGIPKQQLQCNGCGKHFTVKTA